MGLKRLAVLYINSDWGRTAKDLFAEAAKKNAGEVVGAEGYLADEKDFRSAIVRVGMPTPTASPSSPTTPTAHRSRARSTMQD